MKKQLVGINKPGFKSLKQEVYEYLLENGISTKRPMAMLLKSIFLWSFWFVLYSAFLAIGKQSIELAILLTFPWTVVMLIIQLSVMHDASHGAASDHAWLNRILTCSIAFLGGSALLWKNQHCQAHHSFTNIHKYDHDIDTHGLLRLHSDQDLKNYHKYQHIYAWLLYPLFVLSWVWWGDLRDIIYNTYSISSKRIKHVVVEVILIKIWHLFLFLVVPAFLFGSILTAIICYLISFSVLGFCMVVIFQLAHVTGVQKLPSSLDENKDWVLKQISTTANFSMKNHLLTWCVGGLNFQIEHHLFPLMSHLNYPLVQPIVKKYCMDNGLVYFSHNTLLEAVKGHQYHLRTLGLSRMNTSLNSTGILDKGGI